MSKDVDVIIEKICNFCKKYNRIFLYGAGVYGKLCSRILKKNHLSIAGFLQSTPGDRPIEETPVYSFSDIATDLSKSDGIILSMKEAYQSETLLNIPPRLRSQVLSVSEDEWVLLHLNDITQFFLKLYEYHSPNRYDGNKQWKNILVIRLDCIGDMVWTTPFFRELRRNFPNAQITLVLRPQIEPLIRNCPYIDRIICYDVPDEKADPSSELQEKTKLFASECLVEGNYDVVFLPRPIVSHSIIENVYLAFYSRAKQVIALFHSFPTKKNQLIYEAISPFFSLLVKSTPETHFVEYILDMLRQCNCKINSTAMELWPTSDARRKAKDILQRKENTIYIAVGIIGHTLGQTWDRKNYHELVELCVHRYRGQVHFVICGDSSAVESAHRAMEGNERFCLDLTGKTSLPEVVAVIEACDLYLGSNTGLMHIAAAVRTPVIEISYQKLSDQGAGIWGMEGRRIYPKDSLGSDEEFPIEAIKVDDVEPVLLNMIEKCISRKN